ncbi:hypothetical protein ABI59_15540 [Acidobacteria bacterium Mor1]|nr:hypothetical protein ABI59_15540 [Acidobacteria bacterium Mor1]
MIGLGVLVLVILVAALASFLAVREGRNAKPENRAEPVALAGAAETVRLEVELAIAQLVLLPAGEGEALEVEAHFDPALYRYERDSRQEGPLEVVRVSLVPAGSRTWALFRAKLSETMAVLRLRVPPEVVFDLAGDIDKGIVALELGGLRARNVDVELKDGGIKVSLAEPAAAPLESLTILGKKGSLDLSGLGHASPRRVTLSQDLGVLDLDLRGAWVRDASIELDAGFSGGAIWLPEGVRVTGVPSRPGLVQQNERDGPTISVEMSSMLGRLVVVE